MVKKANRLFLFHMTADEKANPALPVAFAKRVPSNLKTGEETVDEDNKMARDAMISVINNMWRNPKLCLATMTWVNGRVATALSKPKLEGSLFARRAHALRNLDETWAVNWFCNRFKWSLQDVGKACQTDPDTMVQILMFGLRSSLSLRFPEGMRC